jgi:hypothetical protein
MFRRYGGTLKVPDPNLVVLTRRADSEMDDLSLRLARRDIPMLRVDVEDLCEDFAYTFDPLADVPELVTVGRRSGARPLLWIRHHDLAGLPVSHLAGSDSALLTCFARLSWHQAAAALTRASGVRWINHDEAATPLDRVTQLTTATRLGIAVPRTLVTNDRRQACRFAETCRLGVITKTVADHFVEVEPGRLAGIFPRRLKRDQLHCNDEAGLDVFPTMYQEYISAESELRVSAVGGSVAVFRIRKQAAKELWTRPDEVGVESIPADNGLASMTRALMSAFRLQIGALDFLETDEGPVFLEVNSVGDWRYFEQRAGCTPVSEAVERFILSEIGST